MWGGNPDMRQVLTQVLDNAEKRKHYERRAGGYGMYSRGMPSGLDVREAFSREKI